MMAERQGNMETENLLKEIRPTVSASNTLHEATVRLTAHALEIAQWMADIEKLPLQPCYDRLVASFAAQRQGSVAESDARARRWRVRVRLYNMLQPDEPQADSDPDLAADKPGETVLAGLPEVAHHLAELATQFHGGPCTGLDHATLRHRLKSLRPTLSRNDGTARWRVPYSIHQDGAGHAEQEWIAAVNVQREDKT